MRRNGWNPVDLRDTRYNQIIHMVSAANGAEAFYSTEVLVLSHTPHLCMYVFTDFTVLFAFISDPLFSHFTG